MCVYQVPLAPGQQFNSTPDSPRCSHVLSTRVQCVARRAASSPARQTQTAERERLWNATSGATETNTRLPAPIRAQHHWKPEKDIRQATTSANPSARRKTSGKLQQAQIHALAHPMMSNHVVAPKMRTFTANSARREGAERRGRRQRRCGRYACWTTTPIARTTEMDGRIVSLRGRASVWNESE